MLVDFTQPPSSAFSANIVDYKQSSYGVRVEALQGLQIMGSLGGQLQCWSKLYHSTSFPLVQSCLRPFPSTVLISRAPPNKLPAWQSSQSQLPTELNLQQLTMPSVDDNVEQLWFSYTMCGSVTRYRHFRKWKESTKTEHKHTLSPQATTRRYLQKRNADMRASKDLYKNDHSGTICNSQNWKHPK